ncbi:SPbeta prophage-derived aminoglycoside N(3')-acetyltransferase-like protein YokD [subsurface metagenome]
MEDKRKIISEGDVVKFTKHHNTITSLKRDFKTLGVEKGSVIIMHSSLSKIGWTIGGPVSVVKALTQVLTPEGTLVMPTFTSGNSEPSQWENPPVPKSWWGIIRKEMPAFEAKITPTRAMGRIVETFRNWPKGFRSNHPNVSFTAWGKQAKFITENHELEAELGENSPTSRLYDLNGQILLVGVNHENNSSLHLAEYRSGFPGKKYIRNGCAMMVNNQRQWVEWEGLDYDSDDFELLGKNYESKINFKPGKIGLAEARLISLRDIVDFGVDWLTEKRIKKILR